MVPPNETGSISEPVFFALRYNYLFRPYSTILSGRLHLGFVRSGCVAAMAINAGIFSSMGGMPGFLADGSTCLLVAVYAGG